MASSLIRAQMNASRLPSNHSFIVGHCQAELQQLDPKVLLKCNEKCAFVEHHEFYPCSHSFQLSSYDSGFIDEHTMDSSATTTTTTVAMAGGGSENTLAIEHQDSLTRIDEIFSNKTEDDDDDDDYDENLTSHGLSSAELQDIHHSRSRQSEKRVSFQGKSKNSLLSR